MSRAQASWRRWATPIPVASSATSAPLRSRAPVRNRLFPKTRSWFALDAPIALLSPLSVLRLMFALATAGWSAAAALWPSGEHRLWVVGLAAGALCAWVALLEVGRVLVVWCWALSALWIAQVSLLVWLGHGTGLSVAAAAFYVPVGVFAALFFPFRLVVACQGAIALSLWAAGVGPTGVGRAAFVALFATICLSTAALTVSLCNKSIRRVATIDPETGIPNGLGLARRIDERGESEVMVILAVLVRGVDSAREALGYQAGAELLRRAIENVGQVLPPNTTIGRAEVDELVVIMPVPESDGGTNDAPADAMSASARLAGTVERAVAAGRYSVDGVEVALRTHGGIAIAPWDGLDAAELLRRASLSAKQALADGVDVVSWLGDGRTLTAGDLGLLAELSGAVERGELSLVFQPQVEARTGTLVGAEALLRWTNPTHGSVSPSLFIPLAERLGLIDRLTDWVLPSALDAQVSWRRAGICISSSVNLSPVTLTRHDLAEWIAAELGARNLPPGCLTLEITETVLADLTQAITRLEPLREMGVRIAVDDFGSGYTSLSSLPGLPLGELKVDQQFVRRAATSPNDLAIVRTVAELASRLGLVAVAEGVEAPECAQHMASIGYDVLQGYFVARPMRGDELVEFARRPMPLDVAIG